MTINPHGPTPLQWVRHDMGGNGSFCVVSKCGDYGIYQLAQRNQWCLEYKGRRVHSGSLTACQSKAEWMNHQHEEVD